ncbi:uncharacterized protein Fot_22017 [Forsythia ovata]|uniref:Uncharacterized protein n=1 Tax=Forsythia ovata TaxID=205694 RepID=A0ABD1UWW3_9LAMI
MQIWINSIFTVSQDVKECISLAVDSVGLKEMPSYEVEMHDHTDWIKQTQESFHLVEVTEGRWIVHEWRKPPVGRSEINTAIKNDGSRHPRIGVSTLGMGVNLQAQDVSPYSRKGQI